MWTPSAKDEDCLKLFNSDSDSYREEKAPTNINKLPIKDYKRKLPKWKWQEIPLSSLENNYLPLNVEIKNFGCQNIPENCKSPLDYFFLIIDKQLISEIIFFTNINASLKIDNEKLRKNKIRLWRPIDYSDITLFIGMILVMGIVKKSSLKDYWDKTRVTSTPGISELLSRSRFHQIYKLITFRDVRDTSYDNKEKFILLQNSIINNSQFYYLPGKYLSVDESLISFKGRNHLKVYIPRKRHKYGFKAYMLCESTTSYVWNWSISDKYENETALNVVLSLCANLGHKENYHIYMDRWFTSVSLFSYLNKLGFSAIGTLMPNRLNCLETFSKISQEIPKNEMKVFKKTDDSVYAMAWYDKRMVYMLSTINNFNSKTNKLKWCKENKEMRLKNLPKIIDDYNKYHGGIDKFDKSCSFFTFQHKSSRWYIYIFIHFLEIAVRNSFILYSKSTLTKIDQLKFRKSLIESLIGPIRNKKSISDALSKNQNFKTDREFDCKIGKCIKRKRCPFHSDSNHQTTYKCEIHDVPVCVLECYDKHRELVKYNSNA